MSSNKYDIQIQKFKGNQELINLIDLCILDWENYKEAYYRANGEYPSGRSLLTKLKFDILEEDNSGR